MSEKQLFNIINWNHRFLMMEQAVAARPSRLDQITAKRKKGKK